MYVFIRNLPTSINRVDSHLVIKIADFGLAEIDPSDDSFKHTDEEVALPYKWMSIERLRHGLFPSKLKW